VKILDNQIIAQHRPILSESSYWATLRPGLSSFLVFAKQMKNVPVECRRAFGETKHSKMKSTSIPASKTAMALK